MTSLALQPAPSSGGPKRARALQGTLAPTQDVPLPSSWTSAHLYCLDVQRLPPRPTHEEERTLIERARAGEPVRNDILLSLQDQVLALASRFVRLVWAAQGKRLEWLECVQVAMLAILTSFDKALEKDDPYPYLLGVARGAMRASINSYTDLIKTYSPQERITVESLDAPLTDDGGTLADLLPTETRLEGKPPPSPLVEQYRPLLLQLVERLPEAQRNVILLHYGLQEGTSLLSLSEIAALYGGHRLAYAAYHRSALVALQKQAALAEGVPVRRPGHRVKRMARALRPGETLAQRMMQRQTEQMQEKPLSPFQQMRVLHLGLGQKELAERMGVSRTIIRRIEGGQAIRLKAATQICCYLSQHWQRPVTAQELGIQIKEPVSRCS